MIPRLDVHYMTKAESFRNPWTRWIFYAYNAFPIRRGEADRAALQYAIKLLRDGHVLLVYPEGTRSADAKLLTPQRGVAFMARQTGVPIIPVGIWGTEKVLPKGRFWPRRADVHVRFGKPFTVEQLEGGNRLGSQEFANAVMRRIAQLIPEQYRGVFESSA